MHIYLIFIFSRRHLQPRFGCEQRRHRRRSRPGGHRGRPVLRRVRGGRRVGRVRRAPRRHRRVAPGAGAHGVGRVRLRAGRDRLRADAEHRRGRRRHSIQGCGARTHHAPRCQLPSAAEGTTENQSRSFPYFHMFIFSRCGPLRVA